MLNWATRNRLLPLPFDVSRRTRNYADGRGHRQSTPLLDICSLFPLRSEEQVRFCRRRRGCANPLSPRKSSSCTAPGQEIDASHYVTVPLTPEIRHCCVEKWSFTLANPHFSP